MIKPRQDSHPWTVKLGDILGDGEWADYREVLSQIAPLVPEDEALRKGEYYRQYHYKARGREPEPRQHGEEADTIKTGQRMIAARSIQAMRRSGKVEIEYDDINPKRKRPRRIRLAKGDG